MEKKKRISLGDSSDLSDLVKGYSKHWKWFVVSAIFFLMLGVIYLRYATPKYKAAAKIQILEDKSASSELSVFSDLDFLGKGQNNVEDELEILGSRSNLVEVVDNLDLNVVLVELGNVKNSEIYTEKPIKINFLASDSIVNNSKMEFYLEISNNTTFGFSLDRDEPSKIYSYGKNIPTEIGDIVITPNLPHFNKFKDKQIRVSIKPLFIVAESYQEKLVMNPATEFSNILNISLEDANQEKAKDILNNLIFTYNNNAIIDKKAIADKTSTFIDERIKEISTNLTSVDQTAQDFKTTKGVTDIQGEANIALNIGAANRQELENAKTQLNIASGMKDYVSSETGYEVLPSNVGLSDPTIANTTAKYNELVLERNRLLKSADEQNPMIVNLDQQLDGLKQSMQSSLSGMERNLGLQVNNLSSQMSRINSKIYSAPKNEREFRDITRQQQTTESLYLYLLQKREESQITFASSSPKSKVIDNAYQVGDTPVSPQRPKIYLAFLMVGLLLPFSIIYANQLLDNKIHNKVSLEKLINEVPILAELPKMGRNEDMLIRSDDRSVLSESLRILRTNLDYLIKSKNDKKNNIIFVTSSVPGEGKTFISSNLSMIFANTNKKVLLIGGDVRNPKLYTYFAQKDVDKIGSRSRGNVDIGLSEYLHDPKIQSKDIINSMLVHSTTFDVIYSGKIPPNPAELLMGNRMGSLLDEMSEKYDYVIVDTAPIMVVTDTMLITDLADHIVYVTRAGVTETKVLEHPVNLWNQGKLKGLTFVVNDVKESNLGYGGKYGYGYGKSVKKWWKF
ncbi:MULTISPECIES: GumC family protein [unclassified Maribacter]|uniref:GumC family protein n=1 Tax=unclassified Maribacter TaxID=2615042 RepID=UPI00257CD2ED|nr:MULTISPECIES: tyrosine-protein kinase [unclassified Maribacter]|tara:strand:+ start:7257 stop:9635 length:2379 start_codon:yes stop_codon:yes gene_type:complete